MKTFSKFKIGKFIFSLPKRLALSAFRTFLVFMLIFIGFSLFLVYQDLVLVQREDIVLSEEPLEFNEDIYQNILDIWEQREEKFNQTSVKKYSDSFR